MNLKTLLILVVAALGMGTYVYFGIQKPAEKKAASRIDESRIIPGDTKKITHLEIEVGSSLIKIEKRNESFWVVKPFNDLAADAKIKSLFTSLERLTRTREIATAEKVASDGFDLEQFGLKTPKARLEVKSSDRAESLQIFLGENTPGRNGTYIQMGVQGPIVIASMDLDFLGTEKAEDFRETKLITVEEPEYAEVEIKAGTTRMKFARNSAGEWEMKAPWTLPVDPVFTRNQLEKIGLVRVNQFLDKGAPKLGKPDISIVVGFKEGIRDKRSSDGDKRPFGAELQLFKSPGQKQEHQEIFASSDKTTLGPAAKFHYENFTKKPADFISKSFNRFSQDDVVAVIGKFGKEPAYRVEKEKAARTIYGKEEIATVDFSSLVSRVRNLEALRFVRPLPKGPLPTQLDSLTLELKDGTKRTFAFHPLGGATEVFYQEPNFQALYLFNPDVLKLTDFSWASLSQTSKKDSENTAKSDKKGGHEGN